MDTDTVSVKEAATVLGVSARTVRRWIAQGKLPASKVGRSYHIATPDLEAATTARRQAAPSATAVGQSDLVAFIDRLTQENVRLAGQVGFLQAQLQNAQDEVKLLTAGQMEEQPRKPWWRRLLRR